MQLIKQGNDEKLDVVCVTQQGAITLAGADLITVEIKLPTSRDAIDTFSSAPIDEEGVLTVSGNTISIYATSNKTIDYPVGLVDAVVTVDTPDLNFPDSSKRNVYRFPLGKVVAAD
jgi:hypothetical protein